MIDLGSVIRRRRDLAGLSQLELAMSVGYKNGGDISRVETGKQWPDAAKLQGIADALDCSVWELFAEAEGRPSALSEQRNVYRIKGDRPRMAEPPASSYLERGDPPTLDDALKDVHFMLTGAADKELLAAVSFQGMMTRYASDKVSSAINSLVMAVESLRETIENRK